MYFTRIIKYFCYSFLIFPIFLFSQNNNNYTDSLKQVLRYTKNEESKSDILILLSNELLSTDPEKAKSYAQEALSLSNVNDYEKGKLFSLINLSEIYQIKTDLKNSIKLAIEAKEIANRINFKEGYAKSILIIANCFTQLGEYPKSSDLCFEALEIYEDIDDKKGVCDALNGIGIIYFQQNNYDKALEYFLESLNLAKEINNIKCISRGLNNVSNIYGIKGNDRKKTYEFLNRAIEINKKSGQKLWLGINYSNLAEDYFKRNELDSSYKYLNKSIKIYEKLENILNLARTYNQMSDYFKKKGNSEKFLYYANMAYNTGKKNNLRGIIFESSKRLQEYFYSVGDLQNAYNYKSIQYNMKDSLEIESSLTRLSQLELLYDLEKKEQLRKLKAQRKDFIVIIIIVSLLAAIVIFVLLLFRYKIKVRYSKLKQNKLEDEIEFKNKEMAANVMSLMKKNEMLSDITAKLIDIETNASKEETKVAIRRIALDIENTTQEKISEEFEMRFRQVHSVFYEKLIKLYPTLTPNEQRLCAFFKLNMTTKEISSISGQSNRAIEMARFRLRKKLGISAQDINLITFISKL